VTAGHLPIWRLVTLSYLDVWRALRAMPVLFGFAAMIVLAVRIVGQAVPHRFESGPLLGPVADIVENAVQYFCLTPIMIAIHRFIIRGDVTRSYAVDLGDAAFLPFFAWTMAISIVFSVVFGATELLAVKPGASASHAMFVIALLIAAFAAAVWVLLRLIVLFPAIAVRAQGAAAGNAFADTKGYGPRLFAIFILSFIPVMVMGAVLALSFGRGAMVRGSALYVVADVIQSIMAVLVEAVGVVIASHVFLAIGRKVR